MAEYGTSEWIQEKALEVAQEAFTYFDSLTEPTPAQVEAHGIILQSSFRMRESRTLHWYRLELKQMQYWLEDLKNPTPPSL